MIFVFDLDDTICDTDNYSEKYILNFFKEHNLPYKQIAKDVRFAEMKFDWEHDFALNWYKEYGDEMMLNFPCKFGVKETIKQLHNLGHRIVIATARATDWHTEPKRITMQWLKNNEIIFDDIYIGRKDKEKICEEVNADVFVDDDLNITAKVKELFNSSEGKKVFLSTTEYNKNLEIPIGVERLKDFSEIIEYLDLKR